MAANDILYKFIKPSKMASSGVKGGATEAISNIVASQQYSETMANIPVPLGKTDGKLNIVKNFRWTKSTLNDLLAQNTPTITLREMQVTSPAFFHNMSTMLNQIVGKNGIVPMTNNALRSLTNQDHPSELNRAVNDFTATAAYGPGVAGLGEDAELPPPKPNLITEFITSNAFVEFTGNLETNLVSLKKEWQNFKNSVIGNTSWNWSSYLKEYENIYGVTPTNFLYYLPYLEDNYKQISTSWGNDSGGMVTSTISKISDLLKLASPAVGVDLAKTYNYPDSGPSHDINFFLDNTIMDGESHAKKNFRFIYLLLYQNLPNRVNHSALTPPVIYQASLPGVFSYRWSYLSKLVVNFIGTRRPMNVQITPEVNADVIIPEGFEIQLTLTSLVPETKNLMYDSIDNPVTSDIIDEVLEPTDFNF
tara:strand:- start:530 stop:1789 length:1260 start_codon:yes stop_codon:yes gene_type:complete